MGLEDMGESVGYQGGEEERRRCRVRAKRENMEWTEGSGDVEVE